MMLTRDTFIATFKPVTSLKGHAIGGFRFEAEVCMGAAL